MTDKSTGIAALGGLQWLSEFQSDGSRLIATVVFCMTIFGIFGLPRVLKEWAADRKDQRAHELQKLSLLNKVERRIGTRKAERLNLDA